MADESNEVLDLDQDQLVQLTDTEKVRLMKLKHLFSSDGWPLVVTLMKTYAQEAHDRAANAASWEQNRLNIGLRAAYFQVAQLEQSTLSEFINIADERRSKELEANLADELANQT